MYILEMRMKMKADRIIFATGNEGKMKEIRMILADMKLPIQSMKEADIYRSPFSSSFG